jgi:hypothetical protein
MSLYGDRRQFDFWKMRRNGMPNVHIAQESGVTRQAVYQGLVAMDRRVEDELRAMAGANRIRVERINPVTGVLIGHSIPFNTETVIFLSARHGIQVWYDHDGDCSGCEKRDECIRLLSDYGEELNIPLTDPSNPTRMAELLFAAIKSRMNHELV